MIQHILAGNILMQLSQIPTWVWVLVIFIGIPLLLILMVVSIIRLIVRGRKPRRPLPLSRPVPAAAPVSAALAEEPQIQAVHARDLSLTSPNPRPTYWLGVNLEKRLDYFRSVLARRDLLSSTATSFYEKLCGFIDNRLVPDYGERFTVLCAVPTRAVLTPTQSMMPEALAVVEQTSINFLIGVRNRVMRPVVAILLDPGWVTVYDEQPLVRADQVLSSEPASGNAETLMAQAAMLMAMGIQVYFAYDRSVGPFDESGANASILQVLENDLVAALCDHTGVYRN